LLFRSGFPFGRLASPFELFGAGGDGGQLDAAARRIDLFDPSRQHVPDRKLLMQVADKTSREFRHVDEAAVAQPHIDEHPEVNHIDDLRVEPHFGLQVFQLDDSTAEDRAEVLVAGVQSGPLQGLQNILDEQLTCLEFPCQVGSVQLAQRMRLAGRCIGSQVLTANSNREWDRLGRNGLNRFSGTGGDTCLLGCGLICCSLTGRFRRWRRAS
jgi:hypothetical protein